MKNQTEYEKWEQDCDTKTTDIRRSEDHTSEQFRL